MLLVSREELFCLLRGLNRAGTGVHLWWYRKKNVHVSAGVIKLWGTYNGERENIMDSEQETQKRPRGMGYREESRVVVVVKKAESKLNYEHFFFFFK